MYAKSILAALFVIGVSSLAYAGGPPPMYVVVDKVVLEPGKKVPGWVQIHGSFTRLEVNKEKQASGMDHYSKPARGYLFLSLPADMNAEMQKELKEWQAAAGTGKAVAVGSCGDAGPMLDCAIRIRSETVTKPDAAFKAGLLKRFGDVYATDWLAKRPEVITLLTFAKNTK